MRNWKKVLVATVLGGACAMSLGLGAAACDTEEHTHSYDETAWVGNATQHWHPATCGDDTKGDAANHSDENGDGLCDVCGLGTTANHGHTYADVWSSDATNHWHAALCDHDVVADQAAHTLENGVCTVCGVAVDVDLNDALENIAENADKAKQMTGTYEYTVPARSLSTSVYNVTAEMHDDFTYTKSEGANFTEEYWYKLVGEDKDICYSLMGGTYYDEPVINTDAYSVENIAGYTFVNPLNPSETYYGLEQFIAGMYDYASFDEDLEIVETWVGKVETEANGTSAAVLGTNMGYSFNYSNSESGTSPYYFDIDVSFTVAEEGYVDSAEISIVAYSLESLDEQGNLKPSYQTEVIEASVFSLKQFDEITVEEGEEAVTMPVDTDKVLVTDFTLSVNDTPVTDNKLPSVAPSAASWNRNMVIGTISVATPETGDFGYDSLKYTVEKYNNATEEYEEEDLNSFSGEALQIGAYYNSNDGTYSFNVSAGTVAGKYKITVSTTLVSKTYDFEVVYNPTTEISASVATATIYEGVSTTITVNPGTGCNPEMTIDITTTDGDATTATATYDTYNGYYTFTAAKAGTYVVKFTSVANNQATAEVTVTVNTPPEISSLLVGNYMIDSETDTSGNFDGDAYFGFTPASEGATSGVFTFYMPTYWYDLVAGTFDYAYNAETETIDITNVTTTSGNFSSFSLSFDSNYEIVFSASGSMGSGFSTAYSTVVPTTDEVPVYTPSTGGEEDDPSAEMIGILTDSNNIWSTTDWYEAKFNSDGTGEFNYYDANYIFYNTCFTWEYTENGLVLSPSEDTGTGGEYVEDLVVSVQSDPLTISYTQEEMYGMTMDVYSFTYGGKTFSCQIMVY